jgi:hypothetical protein
MQPAHRRDQVRIASSDVPEQHVRMACDGLGVGRHDEVRAQFERTLTERRHRRVVDDDERAGGVRAACHRCDVGEVQSGIRWRLDPDEPIAFERHAGDVRGRACLEAHAERREEFFRERTRRVVAVRRQQRAISLTQRRVEDRGDRRHAGWQRHDFGVFEFGERAFEGGPSRVGPAAVLVVARGFAGQPVSAGRHDRRRKRVAGGEPSVAMVQRARETRVEIGSVHHESWSAGRPALRAAGAYQRAGGLRLIVICRSTTVT